MTNNVGPSPYSLKLQYTGEAWDNATGGEHTGTVYMQNIDAQLYVNAERAFGLTGGSFVVEGFYNSSRSLDTQYVGPAQDPSAIDTAGTQLFRLYQAYYKQQLGDTNLLFGLYDIETEFGVTKPMDIFFNGGLAWTFTLDSSGLGSGPSTYPSTALAFRVRQRIDSEWSVQAAVLNGVANSRDNAADNTINFNKINGAFAIGEVDYRPAAHTKIMAGVWGYTSRFDALGQLNPNGTQREIYGSEGVYLGGATRLYSETAKRGLDAFANIGFANQSVQQVARSLNLGLNYTGPFDARPDDKAGIAMSVAGDGSAYRSQQIRNRDPVGHYETVFEATYRAALTEWLTVQPDAQYFIHPNMDPKLKDDFVFGLHFEIGHVFDL